MDMCDCPLCGTEGVLLEGEAPTLTKDLVKPEPVAWMWEHKSHKGWEKYLTASPCPNDPGQEYRNVRPLYFGDE